MQRLIGFLFLTFPLLLQAQESSVKDILAQSKSASGGAAWDHIRTIRMEGQVDVGGLTGTVDKLTLLDNGSSISNVKIGPDEQHQGYDGNTAWEQDASGVVTTQDSEAAKQSAETDAYIDAYAYWYPQRLQGSIEFAGTHTDAGHEYQVLHVLPQGGHPIDLWIDARTHLIDRTVKSENGADRVERWLDYRSIDGVMLPFRYQTSRGGDTHHDVVVQLSRIKTNAEVSKTAFEMPVEQLHDFAVLDGTASATMAFKLVNNHIYVPASINGHALRLMLDTGGVNLLTPEAAKRVGVKSQGALETTGVGKDSTDTGLAKVDSIVVGGKISLNNQLFRVIPLPGFDQVEGTSFDGLVGYELFRRFVVRIDYANQTVTFTQKADFSGSGLGTAVPFSFLDTTPMANGVLDGIPGQFEVDTGSRGALFLFPEFAAAHNLVTRYGATNETAIGWGVGGKSMGHVARGGTFLIGAIEIQRPVLTLITDASAPTSRPKDDGNIGGDILRRFTVTFDYAHKTLYLLPNSDSAEPFGYDRSGMWINSEDGVFVVKAMLDNGPAERAGLNVDDRIMAVEGTPTKSMSLAKMRRRLQTLTPGSRLQLTVVHGKVTRTVELVLEDLIPEKPREP